MTTAAELERAAAVLGRATATVDAALGDVTALGVTLRGRSEGSGWWTGPQGDDLRRHLDDTTSVATQAWQPLTDAALELSRLHTTAENLAGRLRPLERERDEIFAPSVLVDGPLEFLDVGDHFERQAARREDLDRQIEAIALDWNLACATAAGVLSGASSALAGFVPADERLRLGGLVLPTGLVLDTLVATGAGTVPGHPDPAAVQQWWSSLDDVEQQRWLEVAPQLLGNTDGIPFEVRYAANAAVMDHLLDTLPADDPLRDTLDAFTTESGSLRPGLQIVFFDPSGDGRVAQVFGDIGTADNVSVVVPGMGSTMSNFESVQGNAHDLYNSMTNGAVIAWTGYDAPAGLETAADDPAGLLEVTSDAQAVEGGRYLANFIDGVQLETTSPTTLVGHSYGSLTAGQALLQGAQVDNAVFIGSPGVGVDHVSQFPDGAADNFYAAEIDGDPVAVLEQFGDAPTDPDFGATVFDAGDDDALNPFERHGSYFNRGPALENLTDIVEGRRPSLDSPTVVERGLEFLEDTGDASNWLVDRAQDVGNVPFVDEDPIIDAVQDGAGKVGGLVSGLTETGANWVPDAVDDVTDWATERGEDAVDAIDAGVDRGQQAVEDAVDWTVERGEEALGVIDEGIDRGRDAVEDGADWVVDTGGDLLDDGEDLFERGGDILGGLL